MTSTPSTGFVAQESRAATSPRAGAIAGLLFAILFAVSVTLIRLAASGAADEAGDWLGDKAGWVSFALGLMPFAGMFFLWFIAVVRTRLGRFEDQFFATVFLGSGLIFLAMVFVAAGVAGGMAVSYSRAPAEFVESPSYYFARDVVMQIFVVYAMRMAAIFIFSQAALWLRTKVMPRWMAFLSFVVGFVLLVVIQQSLWIILLFPAWVFLVSLYILIMSFTRRRAGSADGMTPATGLPATGAPTAEVSVSASSPSAGPTT